MENDAELAGAALRQRLAEVERQRDSAFARIAELVGDLETHRDFWKRGQVETEDAKLLASQAHNRAQRLQGRVREMTSRRARDRENEALRQAVLRRQAELLGTDRRLMTSGEDRWHMALLSEYTELAAYLVTR